MDSNQLQNIISDITKNIIEQSEASCVTASTTRPETLVFLTCAIASPQKTFSLIAEKYGPDTEYVVFDERLSYGGIREVRANGANLSELLEKTAAAVNVVLLAPKISTLQKLAAGNDAEASEQLLLKAVLWGLNVDVWLDFKPMKFKRNTFFERVLDALDALTDMGVSLSTYDCLPETRHTEPLTLVTERDVLDAAAKGVRDLVCAANAVVTPAAIDRAGLENIRIVKR
ncbi:MAG: hypothetical protein VB021_06380 [Oscillospiraceae bacterium]|nr:hypothetical protein [Oscillospiraceae bacterium]